MNKMTLVCVASALLGVLVSHPNDAKALDERYVVLNQPAASVPTEYEIHDSSYFYHNQIMKVAVNFVSPPSSGGYVRWKGTLSTCLRSYSAWNSICSSPDAVLDYSTGSGTPASTGYGLWCDTVGCMGHFWNGFYKDYYPYVKIAVYDYGYGVPKVNGYYVTQ